MTDENKIQKAYSELEIIFNSTFDAVAVIDDLKSKAKKYVETDIMTFDELFDLYKWLAWKGFEVQNVIRIVSAFFSCYEKKKLGFPLGFDFWYKLFMRYVEIL